MAVTDQQKIDFLLKKIGFTKTKTGSVVGTGAISGTGKQPFAEAIPSPLIIANGALWNESDSIPTTPPGSDTAQVKVYLAGTSGLRMTADSTSSGQRAFIAYTTYNDTSSARLTNWIDTQFGASYLIKVYKGDPNSGGVALSAAGSGSNDGWFFDYSAGVLNFNDTSVPSGVTDTNIYIVGYRYIGLTGAPTPTGGGNFTFNDLVVSRNFQVAGLSTFNGLVDINAGGQANTFKVEDLTDNRIVIAGTGGELEDSANLTFDGSTLGVTGDATFSGNVSIGGTLTYEDVINVDSVGIVTAQAGIRVTGGVIEALAGENKIPSLYAAMGNLPSAGSYHGMFAHVHATGRGYFAHAGNWYELVNKEVNGVVGTGTETYNIGNLVSVSSTATSFNVTGVTTVVTLDVNGDIDVDGHTNLDNLSVAGVSTFASAIDLNADLDVDGHTNLDNVSIAGVVTATTFVGNGDFVELDVDGHTNLDNVSIAGVTTTSGLLDINAGGQANTFKVEDLTSGRVVLAGTGGELEDNANLTFDGSNLFVSGINVTSAGTTSTFGVDIVTRNLKSTGITTAVTVDINGDLDVDGHTNLDNVSVAGVTTFAGNARFNSTITAGGSAGSNGQYLKTTGSGVEWATFPTLRTRQTFTASSGQTTFSFSYTINFIDVFVNGIKLTDAEFTATNGVTVVLAVGCFVGDIVELVSYNTVSGGGGGGGGGISNVVEDTTPQLGGNLDLFNKSITGTGNVNITGIISATSFKGPSGVTATFVGDGSGLTNVIGSGSGVVVKDDNNVVGTAGTINFADKLSVTPISAGIVTVGIITSQFDVNKLDVSGISTFKGAIDVNADLDVDGHTNLDNVSIAGVVTATSFVGALTGNATGLSGNPSINITDLDVDGHTNLDNVSVAGVTTFTGAISASDIRSNSLNLKNAAGSATYAIFTNGGSALLKHNNTDRLETSASGVTVTGTVAATSYTGDGSQLTGIGAGSTANIITNNLQVLGISTFQGLVQTGTGATVGIGSTVFFNHSEKALMIHDPDSTSFVSIGATTPTVMDFHSSSGRMGSLNSNGLVITGNGQSYPGPVTPSGTTLQVRGNGMDIQGSAMSGTKIRLLNSGHSGAGGHSIFSTHDLSFTMGTDYGNVGSGSSTVAMFSRYIGSSYAHTHGFELYCDLKLKQGNSGTQVAEFNNITGHMNTVGVMTASAFVGDGSGLTNLPGGGSYGNNDVDNHLNVSGASSGQILSWNGSDYAWVADQTGGGGGTDVGITTNLSGSFTASAGTPATINTFAYHDNDKVVEYTVYIKNGSDFQSQKLLAMRDGTTIHSTQFAVMFSSSLLVQCDATISSGNILLRATPETGVSGSTTYKIKREVM